MNDAMEEEVDFTIVTASYNYVNYTAEMLESVKSQEGVVFEHLIYDARSTDGTLDVIRQYDHVDLVVESDNGMSDAINKGFKKARGKWVMWLNSDDRLRPGALAEVKKFAESHPDADIIHGAWNFIDKEGAYLRTMKALKFHRLMMIYYGCYIPTTATFLLLSRCLIWSIPASLNVM